MTYAKTMHLYEVSLQKNTRKPDIQILHIQVDINMSCTIILSGLLYHCYDYFSGLWLIIKNYSSQL